MTRIVDILAATGLVAPESVTQAQKLQVEKGGHVVDRLVDVGAIDRDTLESFLTRMPPEPITLAETGIAQLELLNLLMKQFYVGGVETITQCVHAMKLPQGLIIELAEQAVDRRLLVAVAPLNGSSLDTRYEMTEKGRSWATDALAQSQYAGPVPVTVESFGRMVRLQKISNEVVDRSRIREALRDLTLSDSFIDEIGPALNSGRSMLLYGPPGNGKTSIALRLGAIFNDVIYVPHAVTVEGQVIRVFDPSVHTPIRREDAETVGDIRVVRREEYDARWIPCRRPFVATGGELSLEMLDLSYNPATKFYEAPLHMKALGGCFFVDDLGRQLISPTSLLNRWVVPLERRIDYLKLQTGKTFVLPFEELVIFSTNLEPEDLMDQAFLRRIPYKLEVSNPTREQFRRIFEIESRAAGLKLTDDAFASITQTITSRKGLNLAAYHPKFIVDQVVAACRFTGQPPSFDTRFIEYAVKNLRVHHSTESGSVARGNGGQRG